MRNQYEQNGQGNQSRFGSRCQYSHVVAATAHVMAWHFAAKLSFTARIGVHVTVAVTTIAFRRTSRPCCFRGMSCCFGEGGHIAASCGNGRHCDVLCDRALHVMDAPPSTRTRPSSAPQREVMGDPVVYCLTVYSRDRLCELLSPSRMDKDRKDEESHTSLPPCKYIPWASH